MAAERQKIKLEDLKQHFNNAMNVELSRSETVMENPSQAALIAFVYGKEVNPKQIPALVIEDLKKLGFLNSLKIDMK